jgi:DHA3 family tetracycline resistance protein-like MFS transporter
MSSQVDALGQISGGPVLGFVARQFSIKAGLLSSTILLSPVQLLFAIQIKNRGETQD